MKDEFKAAFCADIGPNAKTFSHSYPKYLTISKSDSPKSFITAQKNARFSLMNVPGGCTRLRNVILTSTALK